MVEVGSRRAPGRDAEQAERLLASFVRNVTRARRSFGGGEAGSDDATNVVTPPRRPRRRRDEATTPFHKVVEEPSLTRLSRRRLLGQEDLETSMDEATRTKFFVELAALYRHGHIDDVVAELERVRRSHPFDVELHGRLADFFLERGDLPRAVDLLFGMVGAYFERRDGDSARRCLERVRAIDPENRRLRSYEKLLRAEGAARLFRRGGSEARRREGGRHE